MVDEQGSKVRYFWFAMGAAGMKAGDNHKDKRFVHSKW